MALIILIIIAISGAAQERLSWKPFAILLALTVPAVALKTVTTISARANLGEEASYLWQPATFAANIGIGFATWSIVFLIGYGIGRWRRSRKSSTTEK